MTKAALELQSQRDAMSRIREEEPETARRL